jgi:formylmethanofuran dehydrogenase subunit E
VARLILFAIIAFAIYYFFFRKKEEEFIMCDECKTFYPSDEMIKVGKKYFCKECYENLK